MKKDTIIIQAQKTLDHADRSKQPWSLLLAVGSVWSHQSKCVASSSRCASALISRALVVQTELVKGGIQLPVVVLQRGRVEGRCQPNCKWQQRSQRNGVG